MFLFTCGCVETCHQQELARLPAPEGPYGGSFIYDPWEYHGSDQQFHYFVYTYNRNNILLTKYIRIPRNEITLINMPETPPNKKRSAAAEPLIDSKGNISGFEKTADMMEQMKK